MLLLGIDVGTSYIKVSVVDGATQQTIASTQYPDTEREIIALQPGWTEQSPERWWEDVKIAIKKVNVTGRYNSRNIGAIGISYQMHGLVLVDKQGNVLRNSIIWCDSRAGQANMFLSPVFCNAFVNVTGTPVELYNSDGSVGAALGAGIGVGFFKTTLEAFASREVLTVIQPSQTALYDALYANWKAILEKQMQPA